MKFDTIIGGMLTGMAKMDKYRQARCLHHDRQVYPEIARELEKRLTTEVVELANRITQERVG